MTTTVITHAAMFVCLVLVRAKKCAVSGLVNTIIIVIK